MKTVKMQLAFLWTCPECRLQNICRGVPADMEPDERETMIKRALGLEPWQEIPEGEGDGDLMHIPKQVQCACGEWFLTEED